MSKKKKIMLSGGGSGGPVSPLLSIAIKLREKNDFDYVFVGRKTGVEKEMTKKYDWLSYKSITSGKLRRYFDFKNFFDIFKIVFAFFQSIPLIIKKKPDLIISAGSFISPPLIWASWLLRVPVLIYQLDIRPGLANKLMAPFATTIATTFEKSVSDYGKKAICIGSLVEPANSEKENDAPKENLSPNKPLVLILGGGTGASGINDLVKKSMQKLGKFCQVVHVTGKNKKIEIKNENYLGFEFLEHGELMSLMKKADLLITRAGLATLSEISFLDKPSIIIPMPNSHQLDNAKVFEEKEAAIVLDEEKLDKEIFVLNIKKILEDKKLRKKLTKNVSKIIKKGGLDKMKKIITEIIYN